MAKATQKKTTKPGTKAAKPGRPAAAKPAKVIKPAAPVKKPAAVRAPVISKDELRAQLEKAQNTVATLRAKSREAVRAAKAAAAHIAELEAQVAQLEKKIAAETKAAKPESAEAKPTKQRGRKAANKGDTVRPSESGELTLALVEDKSDNAVED